MDPLELITAHYPTDSEAYHILVTHSRDVADKAMQIARAHPEMALDLTFIKEAAMLHDIGMFRCHAPSIGCFGKAEYICHGYLGADLVRQAGFPQHAKVCERHTGTGLSLEMIRRQQLPLPQREMMPVTLEEQLICFADKFFSKTKLHKEKSIDKIIEGLARYDAQSVKRFETWCKLFLG